MTPKTKKEWEKFAQEITDYSSSECDKRGLSAPITWAERSKESREYAVHLVKHIAKKLNAK